MKIRCDWCRCDYDAFEIEAWEAPDGTVDMLVCEECLLDLEIEMEKSMFNERR